MRVLIIKTSSLGDVIHTLPALTDAAKKFSEIQFDWVVEENFAEIPRWHPEVKRIIPFALRRWKKKLFSWTHLNEIKNFQTEIQKEKYDYIIDAQGLLKSALITDLAQGLRCGFDRLHIREPIASFFYQKKFAVTQKQHAVSRTRELFSKVLNYELPEYLADYGMDRTSFYDAKQLEKYVVFLHGTTWTSKHWPENYWKKLSALIKDSSFQIKIPWGNTVELERAKFIANNQQHVEVLPRLNLKEIASVLAGAKAIVAVDTGLCHLAAALNVPTISLYGPTNAKLTGAMGAHQIQLSGKLSCAPCLKRECTLLQNSEIFQEKPACLAQLTPEMIYAQLKTLLKPKTDFCRLHSIDH